MTRTELITLCAAILMSGDSERRSTPHGWILEATEMVKRVEKQEQQRLESRGESQ